MNVRYVYSHLFHISTLSALSSHYFSESIKVTADSVPFWNERFLASSFLYFLNQDIFNDFTSWIFSSFWASHIIEGSFCFVVATSNSLISLCHDNFCYWTSCKDVCSNSEYSWGQQTDQSKFWRWKNLLLLWMFPSLFDEVQCAPWWIKHHEASLKLSSRRDLFLCHVLWRLATWSSSKGCCMTRKSCNRFVKTRRRLSNDGFSVMVIWNWWSCKSIYDNKGLYIKLHFVCEIVGFFWVLQKGWCSQSSGRL